MNVMPTLIAHTELPADQQAIRDKCFHPSGTFVAFSKEEIEQSIPDKFEKIVRQYPDRIAVNSGTKALKYEDLNHAANQVAWSIYQQFGNRSEPVVLFCEHGASAVISCLGILKAGKILLAIDPSYPTERIADIFQDSKARIILTDSKHHSLAEQLTTAPSSLINVDLLSSNRSQENLCLPILPQHPAQIVYTSGSSGRPKGLLWNHSMFLHSAMFKINEGHICPDDRILALHSLGLASGMTELFRAILSGAGVFPYDIKNNGLGHLAEYIIQHKITYLSTTPSTFRFFVNELPEGQIARSVRFIELTGEPLSAREVDSYKRHFHDQCLLVNRLGNTEVGTVCRYLMDKQTQITTEIAPVGYAVNDKEIILIDDAGKEVGVNHVGEITVRCHYFVTEYWNSTESTKSRFLPDPRGGDKVVFCTGDLGRMLPDGCLIYLGRKDFEVKIRGYKVALAEIEFALQAHPNVRQVGVAVWPRTSGEHYLVAYIVPKEKHDLTITELRAFLTLKLADYMVPSTFMFLESLPMVNGKLDRQSLPKPDGNRPNLDQHYIESRNEIEQSLVQIWEDVLNVHPVGVYDNFFDLGGHSLLAVRLFAEIEKAFKKRLLLSSLFQDATIEHLADLINERTPLSQSSLVAIQPKGSKRPFFCVHELFGDVLCYMNLARCLGPERPFYALQARGLDGTEEPLADIATMAAHYIEEIRSVQPEGPYALGGLCFGGFVAFEMAQQLRAKGEAVALVALLDSGINRKQGRVAWWWSFLRNLPRDLPSWLIGSLQLNRVQWVNLIKLKTRMVKARLAVTFHSPDVGPSLGYSLIEEMGDLSEFSEQHRKVARAQYQALKQYKPQVYPGRLTLFRARMQPLFSSHKPDKGWGRLAAGGLDIRIVPGNHLGMLQEPHVKTLAKELRACLDKANDQLTGIMTASAAQNWNRSK